MGSSWLSSLPKVIPLYLLQGDFSVPSSILPASS